MDHVRDSRAKQPDSQGEGWGKDRAGVTGLGTTDGSPALTKGSSLFGRISHQVLRRTCPLLLAEQPSRTTRWNCIYMLITLKVKSYHNTTKIKICR